MITVNEYRVLMFESGRTDHSRMIVSRGTSGEDAILKVVDNPFWYDEGVGYDHVPIKYPVTFKAELCKK